MFRRNIGVQQKTTQSSNPYDMLNIKQNSTKQNLSSEADIPVLKQVNAVSLRYASIPSFHLRAALPTNLFPPGFHNKTYTSSLPCYMPVHLIPLVLMSLIMSGDEYVKIQIVFQTLRNMNAVNMLLTTKTLINLSLFSFIASPSSKHTIR
jgi:hypothetical protein